MGKRTGKPTGRPTKYKPEYCDQVVEIMKEGAAIEEVAAEFGVAKSTIYEWVDKHTQFSDALKMGVEASYVWWMREGRTSLRDKSFNYTGWYMQMKNRFGWADKIEQKQDTTIKIEWEQQPALPDPTVIDAEIIDVKPTKPGLSEGDEE